MFIGRVLIMSALFLFETGAGYAVCGVRRDSDKETDMYEAILEWAAFFSPLPLGCLPLTLRSGLKA